MTRAARRLAVLLVALAACLSVAVPAWAHAELVSSEPAPGATVPAGLSLLTLTFSEPIAEGSQVTLFAEQFQAVAGVTSAVDGTVLRASLAAGLDAGLYTVQWRAVSVDGHPVEGSYQFAVRPPFGAGLGPPIVFGTGLIAGTVLLVGLIVYARRRRH
jgi:methionine-rich copper-binding protein CopC